MSPRLAHDTNSNGRSVRSHRPPAFQGIPIAITTQRTTRTIVARTVPSAIRGTAAAMTTT